MHTVERYHDISVGHRVHGHESKCAHLHGHNYRITFVCAATEMQTMYPTDMEQRHYNPVGKHSMLDVVGRVIDFSVIKDRLCMWLENNWDHRFLAHEDDPVMRGLLRAAQNLQPDDAFLACTSMVWVPFNPTAENMAQYLVEVIAPRQLSDTGVEVIACKVEETRKCSATFYKDER